MLINWITSTGDYVLSGWLVEVAAREAPGAQGVFIGRFMGKFCSTITLVGFLIQLLLVSRIILAAGLARALMVTPVVLVGGFLLLGIMPVFLLLQSVLVIQRSLDYSLLNTTRNALLLPTSRDVKYQAKTAIDTFFYRAGDLLSTLSIFVGAKLFDQGYLQFVWMILVLCITMALVAWLVGREYARRYGDRGRFRFRWRAGRRRRARGTRAVAGRAASGARRSGACAARDRAPAATAPASSAARRSASAGGNCSSPR